MEDRDPALDPNSADPEPNTGEVTLPDDGGPGAIAGTECAEAGVEVVELDEVGVLRAERDEFVDHLRRMQADFDNFRKRMARDQAAHMERATAGLVEALLPVLDGFEMALAAGAATDSERLRKGVELTYTNLMGVLEKAGLERIEADGKPFDPAEHEAVGQVEDDGSGPGVRAVVRAGYRMKGRVLRPAMVQVAQ